MNRSLTHIKTEDAGWVVDMTPEMAQVAGVAEGSLVAFYFKDGKVAAEILPPAGDELRAEVRQIADEFAHAFAEMKRRGD
ncbi:MAG TPA: hypothetical protein VF634_07225 [Pyrinomonadaceae bacterium]